jgi:hypothetical protein
MTIEEIKPLLFEATEEATPEQFIEALKQVLGQRASVWKGRCEGDETWFELWEVCFKLKPHII